MAVEKVWKCDLCGEFVHQDALRRLGVRTLDDRPEDADIVEVGPCCWGRPVNDVILHAAEQREALRHGICACCGKKPARADEVTCGDCAGWEDLALDHAMVNHRGQ